MFISPAELKSLGVLGMNRRNVDIIANCNPRRLYPLVDNKLETKKLLLEAGLSVPKLIAHIDRPHEIKQLESLIENEQEFVIKPARGSGGKGILVITAREHKLFFKLNDEALSYQDLQRHISNILSGLYSLGAKPDQAMIEQMIQFDPAFDKYSYQGTPDVRIIVYQGFPVMAMLRLATKESDGKANLHQGAVGVGLHLDSGRALKAIQFNQPISVHPDTRCPFSDLEIPHWRSILEQSAACHDYTGLGYLGVDLVLDRQFGPMIIELNARPGLAIQVANGAGLVSRLEYVDSLKDSSLSVGERVNRSQSKIAHLT